MDCRRFVARLGLIALAVTFAFGCAQERDPINRVEANALDKSFFVGPNLADPGDDPEFYTATTVTDVPYGVQASVFTGMSGGLRRIKWEITESQLNARQTYEVIDGVDGHGARTTNSGEVIASFEIKSHFDIRREYNPQTGEELNIIVENTTDRPWYERQFMRVDWSANKVETAYSFDPLATLKLSGEEITSVGYYPNDPNSPDAPVFDAKAGYFDVTNKVLVSPGTIDGLPSCYYFAAIVAGGTYPYGTCEASEISLRHSFMRIAQAGEVGYRDYEPRDWDGARYNAHGAFTVERLGYNRQYGIIDSSWHHLIQRYNLWDKSHLPLPCAQSTVTDPHLDADGNGTEDQCQAQGAPAGSRCDDLVGQCTIPYALRTTRPNAWHYNLNGADEIIFASTARAAEEWDTAMRLAVQAARRVECLRTAGASTEGTQWAAAVKSQSTPVVGCASAFPINQLDDAEVESVRKVSACWRANGRDAAVCAPSDANSIAALQPMIALCHSPVDQTDDPMCGKVGTVTRPGDLRYHQVNVVPTPQTASPWGFGPSNADPLTGEVLQASINVWNSVTDQSAQAVVDQIRWINGEIPTTSVTSGDYVQDWARAASTHAPGSSPLMSPEGIDQRVLGTGATTKDALARGAAIRRSINMPQLNQQILARSAVPPIQPGTGASASISSTVSDADARLALAKGTPAEMALLTPPWLEMACESIPAQFRDSWCTGQGTAAIDDTILDRASPLRALDGNTIAQMQSTVDSTLAARGQCMMMAPEPNGVVSLAKVMAKKFPYVPGAGATDQADRVTKMWNYLRAKLNYAVIAHEMGHTVGMAHNFASSFDKFNYRPQYWQLRTRGNTVTQACNGPVTDGSTCVGPRYFDPLDQDEIDQMIWMWSQTSVMDYAGDITQDTLGLGVYDYSAARAFYADVVDVRNDGVTVPGPNTPGNQITPSNIVGQETFNLVDTAIQPLAQAFVTDASGNTLHYSQWNNFFGLLRNCRPTDTSAPAGWDATINGAYDPVFDGHIVRSEVCERMPVDYVDWRDMVPDTSLFELVNFDPRFVVARRAIDKTGRPRMPYAFGGEAGGADAGIPSIYRHDNGADIYEEMMFHDTLYEDRHIFDNFRRGRVTFSIYGAYQRAISRYHSKISTLAQMYSFIHDFIFRDISFSNSVAYGDVVAAYEGDGGPLRDFAISSSLAFDHFARVLSRPQVGPHDFQLDGVLRPMDGIPIGSGVPHSIDIPQGSTGIASDVSYGGRPIENSVVSSSGYWNVNQAGDYYEKTYAVLPIVAQGMGSGNWSRREGIDSRWLSSNFSNLFPDGVRRLLGSLLTEDQELYAPRVGLRTSGLPDVTWDAGHVLGYPSHPLGWVSFVPPAGPSVCWPTNGTHVCADSTGAPLPGMMAAAPTSSAAIDPELGFEVQKFVLFYSYVFLPASQRNDWLDMLRLFKLGTDSSPSFNPAEMVEWKDPQSGFRYLAKRFGDEQLFGKTYDKGIGAKMIQWANHLSSLAYRPQDPAVPFDPQTGRFLYATDASGQPIVLPDPDPNIAPADPNNVQCEENRYCLQLRNYRGLLDYSHDTAARVGFPDPWLNGIY